MVDGEAAMTSPTSETARPSWRPDRARFLAWAKMILLFWIVFFPVYFGAGRLAATSGRAISVALPFEVFVPLIPWTIWIYLSVLQLFLLPLFHLEAKEITGLSRRMTAAVVIAGAAFVVFPMRWTYPPRRVEGVLRPLFDLLGAADTPHNLAPSLHVALAWLIFAAVLPKVGPVTKAIHLAWFAALTISTTTTHQHHLIDVATGFALAAILTRLMPSSVDAHGR